MEAFILLKSPSIFIKLIAAVNLGASNKLYQFYLSIDHQILKSEVRAGSRQLLGDSYEFKIEDTEQMASIICYSVPEDLESEEEKSYLSSIESPLQGSSEKLNKVDRNE